MDVKAERATMDAMRARTAAGCLLASTNHPGLDGAMVSVRADDLWAIRTELEAIAGGTEHGGGMRFPDDVGHYDIGATVRRRSPYAGCPDGEWVLELHGSIGETGFASAHTAPASFAPEDVPGLGHLYEAIDAGLAEPGAGWTVNDPAYLAGMAKGLGMAAGIAARRGQEDLSREIQSLVPDVQSGWDTPGGRHPRHPEVDMEDVQVAVDTLRKANPRRRMSHHAVEAMLEAVFARRSPIFEGLFDAKARVTAALLRVSRSAERRDAAFDDMRTSLRRCLPLVSLVTVRQALDGGNKAIQASGLNPWCLNEGLAKGDERIGTWWIKAALREADTCAGGNVRAGPA